jgi:hypothetical protein
MREHCWSALRWDELRVHLLVERCTPFCFGTLARSTKVKGMKNVSYHLLAFHYNVTKSEFRR